MKFFTEIEKNLKIWMILQKISMAKVILNKKNKAVGMSMPAFKSYYKTFVTTTV